MGKKKKKNEDFKKVKIKAGRKIPKHLNETKPEFKAKKIQIKPFANTTPSDLVKFLSNSSLNTNLKLVYLGKLNQELLQSLESSQGGEQIQVVCKYITDDDHRVREAAIGCLKTCLNAISHRSASETLSPLLSILLTFVNCGITHINESIRKDSQKFFAFLLDKCDASLEDHLMQMFLSKINSLWRSSLDADYYGLLAKFVVKSISQRNTATVSLSYETQSAQGGLVLQWEPNLSIHLHESNHLAKRFSGFQDLQLTFQSKAYINVYDKFMDTIQTMVIKDAKSLIGRESNRTLSMNDGQKAASALKISLAIQCHRELLDFWENSKKMIPIVKIMSPMTSKGATAKSETKKGLHIQNEINFSLNRFKKLLK